MANPIPIHDFVSDDSTSIPFKILPLEVRSDYDSAVPHRHNYYELFIFEQGGGKHDIDFREMDVRSGSMHFVSPGQVHVLQRAPGSYGYVILFSRDFFSSPLEDKDLLFDLPFLNNNSDNTVIHPPEKGMAEVRGLVDSIRVEWKSKKDESAALIRAYLNVMLLRCKGWYKDEYGDESADENNPQRRTMQQFRILLEKQFRNGLRVMDYADQLDVTPDHLNEVTKKHAGKTASELIAERVLLEIRRLLLYSEFSIKEIAYFLNFQDPSYFNKFFKNHTGATPAAYREALLRKYRL